MLDGVRERLVCGEQDVENVAFGDASFRQPDPQMRAEQERLRRPRRKAQFEPRLSVPVCSGCVDGVLRSPCREWTDGYRQDVASA